MIKLLRVVKMKIMLLILLMCCLTVICCSEMIEIKSAIETRHQNSSNLLDDVILGKNPPSLDFGKIPTDSGDLNLTFVPWPITRNTQNENQSSNSDDLRPVARISKSLYSSAVFPSARSSDEHQIIPVRQSSWEETSPIIANRTNNYNTGTSAISQQNLDHRRTLRRDRERRRRNEAINHQYPNTGYGENPEDLDADYAPQENHYSPSTSYGADYTDSYSPSFPDQVIDHLHGPEKYSSFSTGSGYRSNRYYENSEESSSYPGSPESWHPHHHHHHPRPPLAYQKLPAYSSCDNPGRGEPTPSLIGLLSAIGSNLLNLFKIGLGSSLSIAIPLIALKFFLIPLKIFKLIKIAKILLKLFFVVPFILRVFAPSIYSAITHHGVGFAERISEVRTEESRGIFDQPGDNSTRWNVLGVNLTEGFLAEATSAQKCPSRVACELGSYLASRNRLPENLSKFLLHANDSEAGKDSRINIGNEKKEREENLTYQAKIDPTTTQLDKNRSRLDGTVSERITRSSDDGQSSFRLDEGRQKKEATEQFSQKNLGYNQHDVSYLEYLSWRRYHRENNRRPRPFVTPASKSPTVLTNPVKMLPSRETAQLVPIYVVQNNKSGAADNFMA